jgi:hypothetical protein
VRGRARRRQTAGKVLRIRVRAEQVGLDGISDRIKRINKKVNPTKRKLITERSRERERERERETNSSGDDRCERSFHLRERTDQIHIEIMRNTTSWAVSSEAVCHDRSHRNTSINDLKESPPKGRR